MVTGKVFVASNCPSLMEVINTCRYKLLRTHGRLADVSVVEGIARQIIYDVVERGGVVVLIKPQSLAVLAPTALSGLTCLPQLVVEDSPVSVQPHAFVALVLSSQRYVLLLVSQQSHKVLTEKTHLVR